MAKILLVEDEKALQNVYADVLRAEGYTVETVDDGEAALGRMKEGGWDLVLLDIILPKMNGVDVMQKLMVEPPMTPNKSVVFLTNIDQGEDLKKALALGNGYIIKSQVTPGDLVQEVSLYVPEK